MRGQPSPHSSYLNPRKMAQVELYRVSNLLIEPAGVTQPVVPVPPPPPPGRGRRAEPTVLRALPCISLGKLVKRARCAACPRDDGRTCDAGMGMVKQSVQCETCLSYVADGEQP